MRMSEYELPCYPLIAVYDDEQSWQLEIHPPLNAESLALMSKQINDKNPSEWIINQNW